MAAIPAPAARPADPRDIVAHPSAAGQVEGAQRLGLVHCVHRSSLLAFQNNTCPTCLAPSNRAEVPSTLRERTVERITSMLSEGKRIGRSIGLNFVVYAGGGLVMLTVSLLKGMLVDLINGQLSPLVTLKGLGAGGIVGVFVGATALSLVADPMLSLGKRCIEWLNPQSPTLRIILHVATVALALTASIWVSTVLFGALKARLVAGLAPQVQEVLATLWDLKEYTGGDVPLANWAASLLACDQLRGLVVGICCPFLTALGWKKALLDHGKPLHGWHYWQAP